MIPRTTGFVASLTRPGGNITGLSNISAALSGKRLELLREAVPGLSRVAFLWNPDVRGALLDYKEIEAVARSHRDVALVPGDEALRVQAAPDLDDVRPESGLPGHEARATAASALSRHAAEQKCSSRPATRATTAPERGTWVWQTRSRTRSSGARTWARGEAVARGRSGAGENARATVRTTSRRTSNQKRN